MGIIASAIKEKLSKAFNPSHLEVIDESHKHAGHAGAAAHADEHGHKEGGGESHFHVVIKAESFAEMTRLGRHRAVMDVISEEMKTVHALSLVASG